MPVINENDTTTTDEISFGDNDFLAAQVAVLVGRRPARPADRHRGLYTADPRTSADAELVEEVTDSESRSSELQIGHAPSPLGSGGMRSKVVAAEMASAAGIPAVIGSGLVDGRARARAGRASRPARASRRRPTRQSSFKLWLKYAKPSHGTVDGRRRRRARAARGRPPACCRSGSSTCRAAFDAGDAVDVRDGDSAIGKGICNYSAEELRRVMGLKSAQVREVLPRATDEAVHRDYFVLA